MQKRRNDEQARKPAAACGRWFAALSHRCLPLYLVGLAAVGCQHSPPQASAPKNDPLLGNSGSVPPAPAPLTSNAKGSQAALPPPPTPSSPTSNAALASGKAASATLDPANDLRINDTAKSSSGRDAGPSSWSGTTLQKPEAIPAANARSSNSPASDMPAPPAQMLPRQGLTLDQAVAELEARGATFLRLDYSRDQQEWQINCSVPNPQNPSVSRTYTYKARTSLEAVRAVLTQLDKDR